MANFGWCNASVTKFGNNNYDSCFEFAVLHLSTETNFFISVNSLIDHEHLISKKPGSWHDQFTNPSGLAPKIGLIGMINKRPYLIVKCLCFDLYVL